jgi:photosystem II stability/assembly factor-like uncharacterized protein
MKKLLAACFFFLSVFAFSQEEWELIHGSDDAFNINDAFIVDTAHIWGREDHTIYFSNDFGISWTPQFVYDSTYFTDIFFIDTLDGWACGDDKVIHTNDGGLNWSFQTVPYAGYMDLYSIFFINKDTGWVAGFNRTIYGTIDGGETWIEQFAGFGSSVLYDLHFFDARHGCASGGDMYYNPVLMATDDGGASWHTSYVPADDELGNVQLVSETEAWTNDFYGNLYKSSDGGFTWTLFKTLDPGFYLGQMHFFNADEALAIELYNASIRYTEDAWNTYQSLELYTYNAFNLVTFSADRYGIASGINNILITRDGGNHWQRRNERFVQIAFFEFFNGWILQEYLNKNLLHSTDGGITWNEVETGHSGTLHQLNFVNDHLGFALTDEPELLKTNDDGVTWEIIGLPFDSTWYYSGLQFLDEDTGFITAYPNLVYKTLNGGQDWETYTLEMSNIFGADFISDQEGWVVDLAGHVARTIDGGENWTYTMLSSNYLMDVDFINRQHGYIITIDGLLYYTNDGGELWEEMHVSTSSRGLYVDFRDVMNGWVICEDDVYRTYDGGSNWNKVLTNNSTNFQNQFTGFFALDTGNAWICSMDGRVFSCADFVGIEEDEPVSDLNIYPNPVHDLLYIQLISSDMGDLSLKLFSIDGKLLFVKEFLNFQEEKITLDFSDYSPGIYFLNLQGTYNSSCFKVIKN